MAENRDFCLHYLHSKPLLGGGSRQNIAITFGMQKLEWCCYPKVKNFEDMFIRSTEYTNVTDGRTDGHRATA